MQYGEIDVGGSDLKIRLPFARAGSHFAVNFIGPLSPAGQKAMAAVEYSLNFPRSRFALREVSEVGLSNPFLTV